MYEAFLKNIQPPCINSESNQSEFIRAAIKELLSLPEEELERRLRESADLLLESSRELHIRGNQIRFAPYYFEKVKADLPPTCDFESFVHYNKLGTGFDPCN